MRSGGETVHVELNKQANVRLLDEYNYSLYRRGLAHRYLGGLAVRSPVRLSIPTAGHWHVAVDLQGFIGSVRAAISFLN